MANIFITGKRRELSLDPSFVSLPMDGVPAADGNFTLTNETEGRLAIKIKCNNIDLYKMRPTNAVLPPRGKMNLLITRRGIKPGEKGSQSDKLVVVFAGLLEEETDPLAVFQVPNNDRTPMIWPSVVFELVAGPNNGYVKAMVPPLPVAKGPDDPKQPSRPVVMGMDNAIEWLGHNVMRPMLGPNQQQQQHQQAVMPGSSGGVAPKPPTPVASKPSAPVAPKPSAPQQQNRKAFDPFAGLNFAPI